MSAVLDDMMNRLGALPEKKRAELARQAVEATKDMVWIPSPGPQTEAYFSKADILLYGGEPGGGKSSLALGLALTQHRRSLIMRRQYTDLGHLIEEALKFNGGREGFNGSPPPRLRRPDGRLIDFFAASKVGDEQHRQGNPFDLLAVDEATQLAESQIRFLMGWLRCADDPNQRKRVVLATNPPLSAEGLWVIEWFAPWLDDRFPNPANPGDLRWAIMGDDDKLIWVDGPEPVQYNDRIVEPKSYTYIPASTKDNPFLANSGYDKELANLPSEIREILMGGFKTSLRDQPNQCIPAEWIRLAQKRWSERPPNGVPMCAIGVDASGGGDDPMIMAIRHDGWYAPLIKIPGRDIPMDRAGAFSAGLVISNRRDQADIILDMGGGYGGPMYEHLKANDVSVSAYKGAESCARRSRDGKLRFTNKRTAAYWGFREALDPGQPGGSPIALPDDPRLLATMTAPTFEITPNGIKLESKEKVCDRIGHSTDEADAVVMAWFEGPKEITHALDWIEKNERKRGMTKLVTSGRQPLSARRR